MHRVPSAAIIVLLGLPLALGGHPCAAAETARLYDLSDLLVGPVDFPPPLLGETKRPFVAEGSDEAEEAESPTQPGRAEWHAFMHEYFDPLVAKTIVTSARFNEETLAMLVSASPQVHTCIAARLAELRVAQSREIEVACRGVRMPLVAWRQWSNRMQIEWHSDTDRCSHRFARMDRGVAEVFLEQLCAGDDTERLSAPSLTCFDGQLAHAAFISQVAFIHPASIGPDVSDPVISVVNCGSVYGALPKVQPGDLVILELTAERLRLIECETMTVPLEDDATFPVEVPHTVRDQLCFRGLMGRDDCVLIWRGIDMASQLPQVEVLAFTAAVIEQ